ncbi:uncharacterized protein [Nicotiana tomentosiformis]|uniref:Reverse transcriptase zinc-binding domain-containing protein n=1 Tax=Nicotiana tabacum TaxID=4097 RepID=A0A1S4A818_TOBAC|nr:PREDICTED: uncharacterized protein LOC107794720 [Nicotiana tabacum]
MPKRCFTSWLAMHRKLLTKDRLLRLKISQDNWCIICGSQPETVEHLFFECKFSAACLQMLLKLVQKGTIKNDVKGVWHRSIRAVKGKKCRALITAMTAVLIYIIWWARNEALWNQRAPSPGVICAQVQQECKIRVVIFYTGNVAGMRGSG